MNGARIDMNLGTPSPSSALAPFPEELSAEIDRVLKLFAAAEAKLVELPTLLPAAILLDLYGEDIRNRAYLVHDLEEGDLVLRPDFTVPILSAHIHSGSGPARYAASGRVWRRSNAGQKPGASAATPNEDMRRLSRHGFWQIGLEIIGDNNGSDSKLEAQENRMSDAEIFRLASDIARDRGLEARIGDLGLIIGLIDELVRPDWRRAALKRHLWRPNAFARLLKRYQSGAARHAGKSIGDLPQFGRRSEEMVNARLKRLREDAQYPPISAKIAALLSDILAIKCNLAEAPGRLAGKFAGWPELEAMLVKFQARNDALKAAGIDIGKIEFNAGFGRAGMEYYDGLVFGFFASKGQAAILGGRYDRLAGALGASGALSAIGLAYRPELVASGK